MTSTETRPRSSADDYWASLVAAGIPVAPPRPWFSEESCPEGSPFTITTAGQVYGKVAPRDIDHVGLPGRGVRAPYSRCDHAYFRTGQTRCADGSLVSTGPITMLTGHADLDADSLNAASHYDNNGTAIADIVTFDRPDGVYCAGAARPGVSPEQIRQAMGSIPSGDWRWINADDFKGQEMVACLLVNHGGFPTRRDDYALAASLGWDTKSSDLVLDWDNAPRIVTASSAPAPTPQESRMLEQTTDADTPESLAAASGNPFAKGEPSPPSGDEGGESEGGFDSGDTVSIGDSDLVGQVVQMTDDGAVVVELSVPASMLEHADEDDALAASARFTGRMRERAQQREMSEQRKVAAEQAKAIGTLVASVNELLADSRAQKAERLIASAGLNEASA